MKDFVHLHLHTEFSLLDGACRIDELLDEAQRLKMPAMAVTEHGNMFSSVVFHDAARKRGINPILGCEVYVAPGDRRDKSGTPGETANHLVLLAENEKGFKNLIKLVSSGYTEGFYYKPRIDKDLLAQHAEGLIGLSSCLKGEVATGIRSEQSAQGPRGRRAVPRHSRQGQLLPRNAVPGHRGTAHRQQRPSPHRPRPGDAVGGHQRRALPASRRSQAPRHPAVHRHRQVGERREPPEVSRRPVFPEDRGADGRSVRRLSRGDAEHAADRRALQRHDSVGPEPPAEVRRARGVHARRVLRACDARRLQAAARAPAPDRREGRASSHAGRVRRAPRLRDRHDQEDGVPRVLHDRVGFHPLRARARHPGGTGPRFGSGQPGGLGAAHYRR